jgi:galactose oxidase
MFCPGMSLDFNGRAITTGGDTANRTSIFDPLTGAWVAGHTMNIPRGYQASATVSDGRLFVIGGSWSGAIGGKNGEIYDGNANTWTLLPGCPVAPMLTNDAQGVYRQDNHGWLFGWKNGYVFQAGPSKAMNWYGTTGTGSQVAAGLRASDGDSMCGNAVMYDAVNGKIFTAGGSPSYQDSSATNNVHLITIGSPGTAPTVTTLTSMTYHRAFANSVVLPDGKIIVTGGQSYPVPFSDATAILNPELWDPKAQAFTTLPPHTVPRTYHSIALLMLDGRVFTGGGGLCGNCGTNHEDAQIYSPAYLFNADGSLATRPVISSISATSVPVGGTFSVTTNTAVTSFSLIRFGSATHTVDTDQRRIAYTSQSTTSYVVNIPSDAGVALPGYWMVFALNSAGVPSIAKTIKITL